MDCIDICTAFFNPDFLPDSKRSIAEVGCKKEAGEVPIVPIKNAGQGLCRTLSSLIVIEGVIIKGKTDKSVRMEYAVSR